MYTIRNAVLHASVYVSCCILLVCEMRYECVYTIRNAGLHANVSGRSAASAPTETGRPKYCMRQFLKAHKNIRSDYKLHRRKAKKSGTPTKRCGNLKTPAHLATVLGGGAQRRGRHRWMRFRVSLRRGRVCSGASSFSFRAITFCSHACIQFLKFI